MRTEKGNHEEGHIYRRNRNPQKVAEGSNKPLCQGKMRWEKKQASKTGGILWKSKFPEKAAKSTTPYKG